MPDTVCYALSDDVSDRCVHSCGVVGWVGSINGLMIMKSHIMMITTSMCDLDDWTTACRVVSRLEPFAVS